MSKYCEKSIEFICDEESPTFVEYGLLVIVIALVVVAAATFFGTGVAQFFQDAADAAP